MLKKYILRLIYNYNLNELDILSVAYVSLLGNTFKHICQSICWAAVQAFSRVRERNQ